MAETVWKPKTTTETVAYPDDWSSELAGDTIASYAVTKSGTATVSKSEQDGAILTHWIAGGTDQTSTTFTVTVTTGTGQVLERTYSLYIADGSDSHLPRSTTKRQLIEQAFAESTINAWEYDIDPAEKNAALIRLDAMMWELRGRGLEIGYNFPTAIDGGDLDDDLGCPDQAFFGLSILLALRLCPTMGKKLSVESRQALNDAMKAVRAIVPAPSMVFASGTPLGAGHRASSARFAS